MISCLDLQTTPRKRQTLVDDLDLKLTRDEQVLLSRIIRKLEILAIERNRARWRPIADEPSDITVYCSFCGRSQDEVEQLIAGPTVYICDACVSLCVEIQEDNSPKTGFALSCGLNPYCTVRLVNDRGQRVKGHLGVLYVWIDGQWIREEDA